MNQAEQKNIQIGDTVIYQKLKEEVVLLNIESQRYYGLDDVGSARWDAILKYGDVESAAAVLEKMYDVDGAVLRADLAVFLRELSAAGLLTTAA